MLMTTTSSQPKRLTALDELFENADHWTYSDEGHFCAEMSGATHLIPEGILAREHPLLPPVLRHMINRGSDESGASKEVDGYYAYLTRELLLCPPVELMNVDGEPNMLTCITRLYPADSMGDVLGITATQVSTETVRINDHDVHIVLAYKKKCFELPACFLEAQYPGCAARWTIGHNLEVPFDNLVSYAFSHHQTAPPLEGLATLDFD